MFKQGQLVRTKKKICFYCALTGKLVIIPFGKVGKVIELSKLFEGGVHVAFRDIHEDEEITVTLLQEDEIMEYGGDLVYDF